MKSVTLSSESMFSRTTYSSSPYSTTPTRPLKFIQLCFRPKNVVISRFSVKHSLEFSDAKLGHYHDKVYHVPRGNLSRVTKSETSQTTQLVLTDACRSESNELMSTNKSRIEYLPPLGSNVLDIPFSRYVKFMMLFGIFAIQNTREAVAGSDVASGFSVLGDLGDISTGFASAFLLIFFSELGDKTFFIAALLAARNSAAIVFLGTFGALGLMTIISVVLGRTFHYVDDLLPFRFGETDLPLDDIAAVILLVYFGVSTLLEASSSDGLKAEEEQKEAELAVSEVSGDGAGILAAASTVVSTFLLVFVAEWGDKSFFSTIGKDINWH
ncbi:hypothetical protein Leryth_014835 [Lithospermum erythrorhizon]|nr:hypothetical protein Leryth_014835 [Lithospermum erythrorhizon]